MLKARNLRGGNCDVTVIAEAPKVGPVREQMRRRLAELLGVTSENVNIKATTTERLGFLGRAEGIAAQAVVLLLDG
jgi:2-C-methyl-D-erythritol 2,4-cyclodiphosphate synthase